MKKFSETSKVMMLISFILMVFFILFTPAFLCLPDAAAAAATGSVIAFLAVALAPDHEKYKN